MKSTIQLGKQMTFLDNKKKNLITIQSNQLSFLWIKFSQVLYVNESFAIIFFRSIFCANEKYPLNHKIANINLKQYKLILTWPVSVSNLYNRIAGLFEPIPDLVGVTDGAIIIHETGFPVIIFPSK